MLRFYACYLDKIKLPFFGGKNFNFSNIGFGHLELMYHQQSAPKKIVALIYILRGRLLFKNMMVGECSEQYGSF